VVVLRVVEGERANGGRNRAAAVNTIDRPRHTEPIATTFGVGLLRVCVCVCVCVCV